MKGDKINIIRPITSLAQQTIRPKTVLRRRLKDVVVDWWSLMSVGRLFQTRGAATANALSPNFLRVRGRNRLPLSADRCL